MSGAFGRKIATSRFQALSLRSLKFLLFHCTRPAALATELRHNPTKANAITNKERTEKMRLDNGVTSTRAARYTERPSLRNESARRQQRLFVQIRFVEPRWR